ncbi:MAG: hypothetical protein JW795_24050 [Chitinivibrionales bacterium]|nr:hypothetical protein [Chitinivibrionales bacterium]
MNCAFFWIFDGILLVRLIYLKQQFHDKPLSVKLFLLMLSVPVVQIVAVYQPSMTVSVLSLGVVAVLSCGYLMERYWQHRITAAGAGTESIPESSAMALNMIRLGTIVFLAFSLGIATFYYGAIEVWSPSDAIARMMRDSIPFAAAIKMHGYEKILIMAMGALMIMNEINMVFRFIYYLFDIEHPGKNNSGGSEGQREFNNGRIIGILERTIIYILVLSSQYSALGFILAAKAFTRFKELDNKQFAEYVLIGTLLSLVLAILVSLIVKQMLAVHHLLFFHP